MISETLSMDSLAHWCLVRRSGPLSPSGRTAREGASEEQMSEKAT